jgi:hypothetical protein
MVLMVFYDARLDLVELVGHHLKVVQRLLELDLQAAGVARHLISLRTLFQHTVGG